MLCPSSVSTNAGVATAAAQARAPSRAIGDGVPMAAQSPRRLLKTARIVYLKTGLQGGSDKAATFLGACSGGAADERFAFYVNTSNYFVSTTSDIS